MKHRNRRWIFAWAIASSFLQIFHCEGLEPTEISNSTLENNDSPPKEHRSVFSPRMDYEQWTPLGSGDPLKNDPTYVYVPPVLDRVHYWMDPALRKPDPPLPVDAQKTEILLLGVSSKKPSSGLSMSADNRRDTFDPFIKYSDAPKFNYQRPRPNYGSYYSSPYFSSSNKNKILEKPIKEQRVPYTMLVPPPIPNRPTLEVNTQKSANKQETNKPFELQGSNNSDKTNFELNSYESSSPVFDLSKLETNTFNPNQLESNKFDPNKESNKFDPNKESNKFDPNKEFNKFDPNKLESTKFDQNKFESNKYDPNRFNSNSNKYDSIKFNSNILVPTQVENKHPTQPNRFNPNKNDPKFVSKPNSSVSIQEANLIYHSSSLTDESEFQNENSYVTIGESSSQVTWRTPTPKLFFNNSDKIKPPESYVQFQQFFPVRGQRNSTKDQLIVLQNDGANMMIKGEVTDEHLDPENTYVNIGKPEAQVESSSNLEISSMSVPPPQMLVRPAMMPMEPLLSPPPMLNYPNNYNENKGTMETTTQESFMDGLFKGSFLDGFFEGASGMFGNDHNDTITERPDKNFGDKTKVEGNTQVKTNIYEEGIKTQNNFNTQNNVNTQNNFKMPSTFKAESNNKKLENDNIENKNKIENNSNKMENNNQLTNNNNMENNNKIENSIKKPANTYNNLENNKLESNRNKKLQNSIQSNKNNIGSNINNESKTENIKNIREPMRYNEGSNGDKMYSNIKDGFRGGSVNGGSMKGGSFRDRPYSSNFMGVSASAPSTGFKSPTSPFRPKESMFGFKTTRPTEYFTTSKYEMYPMTLQAMQTMQPPPVSLAMEMKPSSPNSLYTLLQSEITVPYSKTTQPYISTPVSTLEDTTTRYVTPTPETPPPTSPTTTLTTDPLFKHYKQPSEPLRGPMYLIIQGHSKVKTYGPSKQMYGISIQETNEIPHFDYKDEFSVKHLHTYKKKEDTGSRLYRLGRANNFDNLPQVVESGVGAIDLEGVGEIRRNDEDIRETELVASFSANGDVTSEKYYKGIVESARKLKDDGA